ncbi:MAG: alpha-amylase family glycosyl hydrolase [Calditrichia bacterium]
MAFSPSSVRMLINIMFKQKLKDFFGNNKLKQTKAENWAHKVVVYQIYPRSFRDTDNNGIGDLEGIIEKLDYLNDGTEDSLGVGAIWLSSIYKSPMIDFGYDVSDYYDIDPIFGDMKTFDKLIKEAHRRGIKVIMDFVPNHTSSQHPWFIESRSSKDNPKRNWYIWKDPVRQLADSSKIPPTNLLSFFGGPAWTYDKKTGQYYHHSFLPEQPDLNWRNPEVKNEMIKVLKFWMAKGVDGFRIDSIYHLVEDDEYRDDPPNPNYVPGKDDPYNELLHLYSQGRPETLSSLNSFCEVLDEYHGKFMVTESELNLPEMVKFYKTCANKPYAPFNFNLMSLPWDANAYKKFIDDFENSITPGSSPNYVMGNHDRPRLTSRLGRERARLAAMLLLTLRGIPFIYYGDELGIKDVKIPLDEIKDPWEKRVPGFNLGRDPERTPMQWNNEKYAGFSDVKPWLPIDIERKQHNVENESEDPQSVLNLYRQLIHYRNGSKALLEGKYNSVELGQKDIFAFTRTDGEKILVILNFAANTKEVQVPGIKKGETVMSTYMDREPGNEVDLNNFLLRPNEGLLLKIV